MPRAVTLLELLIAITIMSLIVLGFSSIDLFSRYHVITSDRRATIQNEASYVLEHMTKEISKAIGDVNNKPLSIENNNQRIRVYIDANQDGQRNDYEIAYAYDSADFQIRYYSPYPGSPTVLTNKRIKSCIFTHNWNGVKENFVKVEISSCWDPDASPQPCGTPDNPDVTMSSQIKMPSVSTN